MITSAHIQHYKSVADISVSLRPINIIVGPNGSGKSNILDALYFLHECVSDDIETAITKRHGIDSLRQWSRTRPYNITIEIKFETKKGSGEYRVIISSNRGAFRIIEEFGHWSGRPPVAGLSTEHNTSVQFRRKETGDISYSGEFEPQIGAGVVRVGPDELLLQYCGGRFASSKLTYFRPIFDELYAFSKYNIFPNTLRNPQVISKEATLDEFGSNLSSILKRMNSDKRVGLQKENLIDSLRTIMSNIVDVQIKSAAGFFVPVVRVREESNDVHEYNLSQISDGTLRMLGLLTAFYQPSAPNKIGIEEPELMIHPGALSAIKDAIDSFVSGGSTQPRQVFLTTHSPTLIDMFDPKDIIWAQMEKGITVCDHIRERQLAIIKRQLFSAGELLLKEGFF